MEWRGPIYGWVVTEETIKWWVDGMVIEEETERFLCSVTTGKKEKTGRELCMEML